MSAPEVYWDNEPDTEDAGSFVPIWSPKPGQTLRLVCLSDVVTGVWTHFVDKRTRPCLGRKNGCLCSRMDLGRRWKGYVAALEPERSRVVLAELTIGAYTHAFDLLRSVKETLRGRPIRLWRATGKENARVSVIFEEPRLEAMEHSLPPAPDVRECLRRIWGL